MASQTKAETTYFVGNSTTITKSHAMRTAANSIAYLLPHLDRLAASNPAFNFLDVGCGPGSITLDLARRHPAATFVGIDGSAQVIAQAVAAKHAAGHPGSCRFEVGDVMRLAEQGFVGFDVVHVHQVLQHVPDAAGAMVSLRGAAKVEGGVVAVREFDWGMIGWYPESPGLDLWRDLWLRVARKNGNDPFTARKLKALAMKAGWSEIEVESGADGLWTFDTAEKRGAVAPPMIGRYAEDGTFAGQMRDMGMHNVEADLKAVREGWEQWAKASDGWMAQTCVHIVCTSKKAEQLSTS
ncbi:hypothetical protein FH972_025816 [Carpinus fangiana]|uniref:Methyltransferase domain-containing protein n=1 Tax=Carpinus fangiana TaxID=176857 RepID=A0A5N6L242_9ROSI|nr:hypothetical protein FH972_025816 [Carpinus fangiana]